LSILQRKVCARLHELPRTRLLHSLHELRSCERRSALLKTSELSGLRNDRLESQGGLDVGDVLLAHILPLLLLSHLASEGLLHRRVPLSGGREDVLERLLSLSIGDIARCLTALEQAKSLLTALNIRVGYRFTNSASLAQRRKVAEDVSGGGSTGAGGLFSRTDHRWIECSSLGETGGDLAFEIASHLGGRAGITRACRYAYALVNRSFGNSQRFGGRTLANIAEKFLVKTKTSGIKGFKFSSSLASELGSIQVGCLQLSFGHDWSEIGQRLAYRFGHRYI